jgi:hypothetical protein
MLLGPPTERMRPMAVVTTLTLPLFDAARTASGTLVARCGCSCRRGGRLTQVIEVAALEDHRVAELDPERLRTYRWFVRGMFLFAAHAIAILIILALVFL